VSANGNTNGIVWALDNSSAGFSCCQVLFAYDATNLAHELYNSNQAPNGRDSTWGAVKFTVPTIANGKVYVGTQTGVAVLGLLPVVVSPVTLSFGAQLVGIASSSQQVMLTNLGNAALTITSVVASTGYAQTNNCGSSVQAGASCTINVTFLPSATNDQPGTLTITDSARSSPQVVGLTGTGADFMLSALPSSATVAAGQTATYTLSATSLGGFNQAVPLACTGAPPLATCAVSPDSINPGGTVSTATIAVSTVAPTWAQPRSTNPRQYWWGTHRVARLIALLLALTCLIALSRGRRRMRLGFTVLVLLLLLWTACGGGWPGTPPGAYTLTVTGTATSGSASVTHNVTMRLTVQ